MIVLSRKIIDCEHHFYGKCLIDYMKTRKDYPMYDGENNILKMAEKSVINMSVPSWNDPDAKFYQDLIGITDQRIKIMDRAGIDVGVISTSDSIECFDKEDSVRLARETNDEVAAAIKKYPGRFEGTICLPTPYVDEAVKELERAVKVLGLKYWHTHSSIGKDHIYEDKYEPIFAKCAELGVPFYIHPCYPTCDYLLDRGFIISGAAFGFAVDVMKTSMALTMNGVFDRYPNLTMVLGHMAELYPWLQDRMDHMVQTFKDADPFARCEHTFDYYFKNGNIKMTTSGIFDPEVILFAIRKFGIDSILFGTDCPYEDIKKEVDVIKALPISEEDKDKIFYKNAEKYILKK